MIDDLDQDTIEVLGIMADRVTQEVVPLNDFYEYEMTFVLYDHELGPLSGSLGNVFIGLQYRNLIRNLSYNVHQDSMNSPTLSSFQSRNRLMRRQEYHINIYCGDEFKELLKVAKAYKDL